MRDAELYHCYAALHLQFHFDSQTTGLKSESFKSIAFARRLADVLHLSKDVERYAVGMVCATLINHIHRLQRSGCHEILQIQPVRLF